MKKIMISVLLLALVCSAAFASVVMTPAEGWCTTVGAKLSFGKVKKSIGVSEVMLYEGVSCHSETLKMTFGEKVGYTYSFADNDNTKGLLINAFVNDTSKDNCSFLTDALLSVPRVNGELKPASLSVVTGMKYAEENFITDLGDSKWNSYSNSAFDVSFAENALDITTHLPDTRLGFIYSFDKDPSKSGIVAGLGGNYNLEDGKSVAGRIEGVFHYIDGQVKVEDFVARAEFDKGLSNGKLEPWVEYRYSYNAGPEVNGLFVNLVPMDAWFGMDVAAWLRSNLIVSLHMVDGKVSFQLNEAGLASGSYIKAYGTSGNNGIEMKLGYLRYVYSPANSENENGVFMELEGFAWAKPVDAIQIRLDTKTVLHANYIDDQIKVDIQDFRVW